MNLFDCIDQLQLLLGGTIRLCQFTTDDIRVQECHTCRKLGASLLVLRKMDHQIDRCRFSHTTTPFYKESYSGVTSH